MNLVILGKNSFLGNALEKYFLTKKFNVSKISSASFSIDNLESLEKVVISSQPKYVINCIAMTKVDDAEKDPKLALLLNTKLVENIAKICQKHNIKGINFSTDYVFDGRKHEPYTESDVTNPLSIYGKTKLEGELKFSYYHPKGLQLRTAWLYGEGKANFITNFYDAICKNKKISTVIDQVGSPTWINDLAYYTDGLKDQSGLFHVVNKNTASRVDCYLEILAFCERKFGFKRYAAEILEKKLLKDFPFTATRPSYSCLDCTKASDLIPSGIRSWKNALKEFLFEYSKRNSP